MLSVYSKYKCTNLIASHTLRSVASLACRLVYGEIISKTCGSYFIYLYICMYIHSMTVAIRELHWLPVVQRIQFKLLTLMHGAVHAKTPCYLADRISPYVPCCSLRLADQSLVVIPRVNLERLGR